MAINSSNKIRSIESPKLLWSSLFSALGVTVLFAGFSLLFIETSIWLLLQCGAVFIFTFGVSFAFLELVMLRKLRNLYSTNLQEITKLKKLDTFRRDFIGDVSHELKTPIFAIEGFIETLLDGALEDPKVNRKFLQKALRNSERLSNLVQDILVINQIESGELEMNLDKFRINDLLMEVVESFEHKFTKRGRSIRYRIVANGQESALVIADKERIEQVLRNLIDNAIKYGDPKGIIDLILESKGTEKLVVKVKDNGPGISPDHLPRLFERFYRVDKSRSREKGGTGLGLAICKHFIEAHKEKIWVESVLGEGATFQFSMQKTV